MSPMPRTISHSEMVRGQIASRVSACKRSAALASRKTLGFHTPVEMFSEWVVSTG